MYEQDLSELEDAPWEVQDTWDYELEDDDEAEQEQKAFDPKKNTPVPIYGPPPKPPK